MKRLLMLSLICFGLSITASANEEVKSISYVSHCSNFATSGQPVSYSFSSCINNNFHSLGREFDSPVYTSYCSNIGRSVSFSFISCINNNFRTLARALDSTVYISNCASYDSNRLSPSFVSCANNNFRRIQYELSRQ